MAWQKIYSELSNYKPDSDLSPSNYVYRICDFLFCFHLQYKLVKNSPSELFVCRLYTEKLSPVSFLPLSPSMSSGEYKTERILMSQIIFV